MRLRRPAAMLAAAMLATSLLPAAAPASTAQAAEVSFTRTFFGDPQAHTSTLVLGDMNNDGSLDVVEGSYTTSRSAVYFNDGHGGLSAGTEFGGVVDTEEIAVGDLNGDGFLDIVQCTYQNPSIVYWNDTHGGFSAGPMLAGSGGLGIALGDVNSDGKLDIVVANFFSASMVFLNKGQGKFEAGAPYSSNTFFSNVLLGDVNNDGLLDIISGDGSIYRNDPANIGAFKAAITYKTLGNDTAAIGDLNGDGALDIVSNGRSYKNNNTGDGSFSVGIDFGGTSSHTALGDLDGDGNLDIVQANLDTPTAFYINAGYGAFPTARSLDGNYNKAVSVVLGDLNGDGALDIVLGNQQQQNILYLNTAYNPFPSSVDVGDTPVSVGSSLALGDVDGKYGLDIIQGTSGSASRVFLSTGQGTYDSGHAVGGAANTTAIALADLNNDGSLDIIQGNRFGDDSFFYLNNKDGTYDSGHAFGGQNPTTSIAVGDLDNDGRLDIIQGNRGQQSVVYLNKGFENGSLLFEAHPFGAPTATNSVAIGDLNSDGALDIVLGNDGQRSSIYLNDGNGGFSAEHPFGLALTTYSVALGDMNGDSALDIVQANYGQSQSVVSINTGDGISFTSFPYGDIGLNQSVALGDLNGDGALDIVQSSTFGQQSVIYLNDRRGNFPAGMPFGRQTNTTSLAVGDMNGDGALDIVQSNDQQPIALSLNQLARAAPLPNNPPSVSVRRPGPTPDAGFYSAPAILSSRVISLPYSLADPEGDPARAVRGEFSLDGGGSWRPAVAATPPLTATLPGGLAHMFAWDTFASGLFGQSDNAVFRIVAYPTNATGPNGVPLFQHPFASATTFPFRVRGTQVRVVDAQGAAQPNAVVFRLNDQLTRAQQLLAPDSSAPGYTTDAKGYLRGRGELRPGDQLVALAPVAAPPGPYADAYTRTLRLYNTNIITGEAGLSGALVRASGVQTVTVSPAHPLALFDLSVSLEWDARYDTRFMAQLTGDLGRASELLFQASHGQAALGSMTIFHDRENWDYADLRVYASNRVRPSALIGGVATRTITDPTSLGTVLYGPGQLQMGAVWNRFGAISGNLGEDWPRTLVHELGHYLFFLEDNYIGQDAQGAIVPVTSCPGLMADSYSATWQFQTRAGWAGCQQTFSNRKTGRADWETISAFYPALRGPALPVSSLQPGPARLPLALSEISSIDPLTPTARLEVPIFYTRDGASDARLLPGPTARAYLFHAKAGGGYDRLVPLGRASNDQVLARGARAGDQSSGRPADRICLFEPTADRFGCTDTTVGNEQLPLATRASWRPDITVTPVTSRTLSLQIRGAPAGAPPIRAEIYPIDDDPLPAPVTLAPAADGSYSGTISLANPLAGAYLHLATAEATPQWETVTSFNLSGNAGGFLRTGGAPVASAEGDVLLSGADLSFAVGQFLLLQTTSSLPALPAWATQISQGYRFTTSAITPALDLRATALSFSYLDSDVSSGEEANIQVYYRSPSASAWQAISTSLDTAANTAAIANQGPGLYVLASSVLVRLPAPGWNIFAYPVAGQRAPAAALASIDGTYSVVYSYVPGSSGAPWRVYAPAPAPAWVSDLAQLTFGQGYWIFMGQPGDLLLRGAAAGLADGDLSPPPATIYGALKAEGAFVPAAGQAVEARVGDALCGSATTRQEGGAVVFVVKVAAVGAGAPACGAIGRAVIVSVAGRRVGDVGWDNRRAVDLFGSDRVFLPMLGR